MMLVSMISYVDRNTLAILAPTIKHEAHLSNEQYTTIISCFSVAYCLANPVWGAVLDRVGLWLGMAVAVSLWSLASASHALAGGLMGFAAARALLGFGEGATFPGGLRTAAQTLPAELRSRGIAVAYSGGSLGAIVAPLMVTPIALHLGWRAAFVFTGLLGAFWVGLWIQLGREPAVRKVVPLATRRPHWRDSRLWAFMASYALGAFPLGFVLYISPLYLNQALGQSQAALGFLLVLPPLGWEVGYFFWGWIADKALAKDGVDRHAPVLALLVLLSLPLAVTPSLTRLPLVMGELFFAMFITAGFIIVSLSYAVQAFSATHAAFIGGLGSGSWSAMVALLLPFVGHLFDVHSYGRAFWLAAICPAFGFFIWLALARQRNH
jgi:ACS family hexuronate transporter-like MFS transporter